MRKMFMKKMIQKDWDEIKKLHVKRKRRKKERKEAGGWKFHPTCKKALTIFYYL